MGSCCSRGAQPPAINRVPSSRAMFDDNAQPQSCGGASGDDAQRKSCTNSREDLQALREKYADRPGMLQKFFFEGTMDSGVAAAFKRQFAVADGDSRTRCVLCGNDIAEHRSAVA